MKLYRPTTPSRRQMTAVQYADTITSKKPWKPLTTRLKTHAGRNARGVITVRHQGGGNKKRYRIVAFREHRLEVPARVRSIEYDPYRNAFIALVCYRDGTHAYILAPNDIRVGDEIVAGEHAPLKPGNRLPLKNIPVGYLVHNIEVRRGGGGKLARSAGTFAEVLAQENGFTTLKLSSKEVRKVLWDCFATIGQVSNPDYNLVTIGKAGRARWLGIRPTVRGTVMNPVDHPHGGGEGRQPRGTRRPKTAWGKVTGGRKTRNKKKWSRGLILQRRPKIR